MNTQESFGARLHAAVSTRGPLCAGIDPHASLLLDWGLDDDVAGLERFALGAVDGLAPHVAVVKPQSAFFERHGWREGQQACLIRNRAIQEKSPITA